MPSRKRGADDDAFLLRCQGCTLPLIAARFSAFLDTPAIAALLIQFFSFLLMFGASLLVCKWTAASPPILLVAFGQGVIAALLTCWRRLAWWWPLIALLFAPALIAAQALHLPAWIFLLSFVFMLSIYWSTYRTQVPLYFSSARVWQTVAQRLPGTPLRGIDIGSGIGGLILDLAARRPDCRFTGIELAPLPWLISLLRGRLRSTSARFVRGDYRRLDFGGFDMVFAYLSPAAMPAVFKKAMAELPPGAMLLSYEFAVPGKPADEMHQPIEGGPILYVWYQT